MIGAIVGDIVGSRFEFDNTDSKSFRLFTGDCTYTDDTVCTIATMDWLNKGGKDNYADILAGWVNRYVQAGFSSSFLKWAISKEHEPYNSYGNGAPMRVSPVAWFSTVEAQCDKLAQTVAKVSHNHPEAVNGAVAIANCVQMSRFGYSKSQIRSMVEDKSVYNLHKKLSSYEQSSFVTRSSVTVPAAIVSFLESRSFVDAIKNAVILGGDSDTIASMTGAIADAYYGIPEDIEQEALSYLPDEFLKVIDRFEKNVEESWKRYVSVYTQIPKIIERRKSER